MINVFRRDFIIVFSQYEPMDSITIEKCEVIVMDILDAHIRTIQLILL